jgi:hypothetical protein
MLTDTPYLGAILIGLAMSAPWVLLARGQRRMALAGALLALPLAPLALLHEDEYWTPVRVGGFRPGAEDALFLALCGGMAWLVAVWPVHRRLRLHAGVGRRLVRCLALILLPLGVSLVLLRWGTDPMSVTLLAQGGLALQVLALRPALWPLGLAGLVQGSLYHWAFLRVVVFPLWPGFLGQWRAGGPWMAPLGGVPLGEVLWAGTFFAAWPLLLALASDARLTRSHRRTVEPHGC